MYSEAKLKSHLRTTKEPPEVHEYISYRGLSTGATFVFMMAALSHGIRLSDKRVEEALPFLDVASMVVAAFNDCVGAQKDAQIGQPNLVNMVGRTRAVNIHNMLVDLFEQEAAAWLKGAEMGDESVEFVGLVRASLFGLQFYQLVAPRYTRGTGRRERVNILDGPPGRFLTKESALMEQIRSFVHDLPGSSIQSLRAAQPP